MHEMDDETMRLTKRRVLIADDDENIRALCVSALIRNGYEVEAASNGREALGKIDTHDYHAVLLDLGMPYVHGSTLLSIIGQTKPALLRRVLVMTGAPDGAVDPLIGVVGAILRKPLTIDDVMRVVDQAGLHPELDATVRASA
jgi:DNA-binding NtrC family response regulator